MVRIMFVPDQVQADAAIAECVTHDGLRASLTTEDGRTYTGRLIIEQPA